MKRKNLYFLIIACVILITVYSGIRILKTPIGDSELSNKLNALIEDGLKEELFPGAVLLVVKDGEIRHRKAYGYAQKHSFGRIALENPELMSTEHLFDVASMTKVFATTFAVMLLVDRGEIKLDDFAYDYIPLLNDGEKSKITIRHLLSHRAGLAPWKPVYCHASNKDQSLDYIASIPLKYPVGTERHYSDLSFMILGYIIEGVTGKTLDSYLKENLYAPLGLSNTTFCPLSLHYKKIAATSHGNPFEQKMVTDDNFGYRCDEGPDDFNKWRDYTLKGEVNDGNAFYAHGGVAGHAGLFSTSDDLKILADLLMKKGLLNGKVYMRPETVKTFLKKDEFDNGLGWSLNLKSIKAEGAPEGTFGHTGFTGCNVAVIPAKETVIILLTNRQNEGMGESGYYPDLNALRRNVCRTVLKED
ncbi:MAG: serine hydrolase [Deltaproteobacteria bacterium]|nr:serine hydrolase [Deltaproteobacteria bacterium]MBW2595302.1 serine hydrolase [Deltaproteobacteria bacterium]MBW2650342.1 serine hydrolase [Deltaproteobacteria bacterium]